MTWRPVLEGPLAERAHTIVRELVDGLSKEQFDPAARGLAYGSAGLALFLAYLSKGGIDAARLRTRAAETLHHALRPRGSDDGPDPGADPSLFDGFPGLTWLAAHEALVPAESFLEETDNALLEALTDQVWCGPFDYADGLIGLGVYLLERDSDVAARALARIAHHLQAAAIDIDLGEGGAGVAWMRAAESFPLAVRPRTPVFDLGIPRGTPGAIAFLARVHSRGGIVDAGLTESLLRRAIAWLLLQQRTDDPAGRFGDWRLPDEPSPPSTRLAWCYGDLGVSMALLAAARALGDEGIEQTARALALETTARTTSAATQIEDAGLCHGATGAGHLYARLHAATGEPRFLVASRHWFEAAVSDYQPGKGFSTYYPTNDDATFHAHSDPGLLMGACGIGLALLSACRPIEPAWDRYFLISGRR